MTENIEFYIFIQHVTAMSRFYPDSSDAILLFWLAGVAPRTFMGYLLPLLFLATSIATVIGFPLFSIYQWTAGGSMMLGSLTWAWWAASDSVKRMVREACQFLPYIRKA